VPDSRWWPLIKRDCLATRGSHKHACGPVRNTVCGYVPRFALYDLMAMAGHCTLYGVLAFAVELWSFRRLWHAAFTICWCLPSISREWPVFGPVARTPVKFSPQLYLLLTYTTNEDCIAPSPVSIKPIVIMASLGWEGCLVTERRHLSTRDETIIHPRPLRSHSKSQTLSVSK